MLYKKLLCCSIALSLFAMNTFVEAETVVSSSEAETAQNDDSLISWPDEADGFLNLKASHERSNEYAFGPKNSSAVGLNPVISLGAFTLDTGLYYGRQFSNMFVFKSERFLSKTVPSDKLKDFHDEIGDIKTIYDKAMDKNVNKAYFHREYTRLMFKDDTHNFRVVLGDTTTKNQIGNQQAITGAGISVFRQSGNGSVINSSSPIVITRPTKVECKLGDDILAIRVLAPGTYYIDDLPEEAKLPGVTIKLSDQLNRTVLLTVDYFGGYGMMKEDEYDFDLAVIYASK